MGGKQDMTSRGDARPKGMEQQEGGKPQTPRDKEQMRMQMLRKHHARTQWVYWMLVLLGVWMLFAVASIDYGGHAVEPAGGRPVWLSLENRVLALQISDLASGALLVVLGCLALKPNRPVILWMACFVGIWLNFAPLIFWAPRAVIYLNDTLVGTLVIALTILIPGMPNMIHYMKMGPEKPIGWSYNPSSWPQRSIMIALGFAGWLVSRYLAAFQLGYIDSAWDPFFGSSTEAVLTSKVSESLPVSDGGLGALAYTFEFLMGWMGSPSRWRTMPWMVTFFGILVIPLGMVHIVLVISQPVVVGHWCTLCLLAAAIMLPMIPLEVDEVIAMGQFLVKARRQGQPLWTSFWKGGTVPVEDEQEGKDPCGKVMLTDGVWQTVRWSVLGMSVPWTLAVSTILGLWMMSVPAVLGNTSTVADIDHLAGALVVTFSVIAMGECVRTLRFGNVLLGALIAAGPIFWNDATTAGLINDIAVGLLITVLSLRRGPIRQRYGLWHKYIK